MKKPATLTEQLERPLITPTDLERSGVKDIAAAINGILADVFALYLKTKNFLAYERPAFSRLPSATGRAGRPAYLR